MNTKVQTIVNSIVGDLIEQGEGRLDKATKEVTVKGYWMGKNIRVDIIFPKEA